MRPRLNPLTPARCLCQGQQQSGRKRARKSLDSEQQQATEGQPAEDEAEAREEAAAEGMQDADGTQPTVLPAPGSARQAPDPGPVVLHAWDGVCAVPLLPEPARSEDELAADQAAELPGEGLESRPAPPLPCTTIPSMVRMAAALAVAIRATKLKASRCAGSWVDWDLVQRRIAVPDAGIPIEWENDNWDSLQPLLEVRACCGHG